jgi:hypothetical protein
MVMTARNLKRAIWLVLAISGSALAAGPGAGGGGGGGGGGGKPPVETSNNLSYPIIELTSGGAGGTSGLASSSVAPGTFKTNFAYGCPETDPAAEYANKSCVSAAGTFYDKGSTECIAICGTDPAKIERMYFQKTPGQIWKSEVVGPRGYEQAAYVDWGDALESRTSSSTSVVRVETMPFYMTPVESPLTMQGFEMWHVFGTGKTEMWGARVSDDALLAHYMYDTQYAIIHTGKARLNLAKLSPGAVTCPATPSVYGSSPYDGSYDPAGTVETQPVWSNANHTWDQSLATTDMVYSAELNIQGKYVYGYNWTLKTFPVTGVEKAGWWRLTFYADDVSFTDETIIGAPAVPTSIVGLPLVTAAIAAEIEPAAETEGRLYVAIAKGAPYNLTFIDVCISAAKGGGGRKP